MVRLHELSPTPNSKRPAKRVGRGHGSGRGKTSGRGMSGQNARSGSGVRPGFEGGQMPLQRRLPKVGFNNPFRVQFSVVNVRDLNRFDGETEVTPERLLEAGLVKKGDPVKILGDGELEIGLTVRAHRFSRTAQEKIEKAGGKVEVI